MYKRQEEFDHGGTRRMGAELSDEEFLIFMKMCIRDRVCRGGKKDE